MRDIVSSRTPEARPIVISGGYFVGGELSQTFDASLFSPGYSNQQVNVSTSFGSRESSYGVFNCTYNIDGTTTYHFLVPIRAGFILGFEGNFDINFNF